MSAGDLAEANELRSKAREWMASLAASGVSNRSIAAGVQLAIIELLLLERGGRNAALDWLNGQMVLVATHGDDLARELRR